jgi:hypothetical protein
VRRSICLLAMLGAAAGPCRAEEIAPFRVTGVEGNATLRYVQDGQDTKQRTGDTHQSQSGLRNEISVMTHSYVYHPNLLSLDVGGGPILHNESVSTVTGERASARGALYNFSARATVLRDKPYRGGLFYEHLNPTVSVSPGQTLTQENTRYGADFSLLEAVTPIPLRANYTHSHNAGRGVDRLVDDRIDQFNLGASRSYGNLGSTQVQYVASRQDSISGAAGLPIQTSSAGSQTVSADTRLQFGPDRKYDVGNLVSLDTQSYRLGNGSLPGLRDMRFLLDGRARNSADLDSHANYNYNRHTQGVLDSTSQAASGGLTYRPLAGLSTSVNGQGNDTATRQFTVRGRGVDAAVNYERAVPLGVAQAGYAVRYNETTQQAVVAQSSVIGERVALSGTSYVTLGNAHIVAGSIVVNNASRTQTYVEGIDYSVSVVGTEMRLQRLIGGHILDGEQVLADYAWSTGGTYASSEQTQSLNLSWSVSRYFNAFFRRTQSTPHLLTGTSTFPLNTVNSRTAGIRADVPLNTGIAFTLGGSVEVENRNETIASSRRQAVDVYGQTDEPVFGLGQFRLTARRSRTEYDNALQNVSPQSYDLRYWSREWFGIDLTAAVTYERENSSVMPHLRLDKSIGAQWHRRKFSLSTSLVQTHEVQSGNERNRTVFQFLARRDF